MESPTRRRLLQLLLTLPLLAQLPLRATAHSGESDSPSRSTPGLPERCFGRQSAAARRLGDGLARRWPELVAESRRRVAGWRDARAFLRDRERDFREGDTLLVDGFVLSRSECLLCVASAHGVRREPTS